MKARKVSIIVLLVFSLLLLTGCKQKSETEELKVKAEEEVNYLDSKFISIANKLNNIVLQNYKLETIEISSKSASSEESSSSDNQSKSNSSNSSSGSSSNNESGSNTSSNNQLSVTEMKQTNISNSLKQPIEWDSIKSEVELLYNTWNTIIIDLYKLNVPSEKISEFSQSLNQLTINTKNQNKDNSLLSISGLYSYLPIFLDYFSSNNDEKNLKLCTNQIINAYSFVSIGKWDEASTSIDNAIQSYTPILNNIEFSKYREHSVNRTYIILNETKACLKEKEKEIFFINYKNLINEINLL